MKDWNIAASFPVLGPQSSCLIFECTLKWWCRSLLGMIVLEHVENIENTSLILNIVACIECVECGKWGVVRGRQGHGPVWIPPTLAAPPHLCRTFILSNISLFSINCLPHQYFPFPLLSRLSWMMNIYLSGVNIGQLRPWSKSKCNSAVASVYLDLD